LNLEYDFVTDAVKYPQQALGWTTRRYRTHLTVPKLEMNLMSPV